ITTCLGVKIASMPTHIAGMPVAVTVNCWADRKAVLEL
ncbi:MAG: fumarate hydratase, partial [Deltaproteobacteria bacterium HGW-Deltaproteobacteria-22]